ncbi:uncharacterized protein LOC127737181 [Mytilus californianus]|uniref:uncharacterized protein LOC127737181 n=1 Tax=Mytilus californianus TaxID=6549 RepID=UPI002246906E|nr:uncharacterized protein LOC127737181 [Mytilus californianus]
MAYRASEHETTGQTPNRLMFGRESTTPLDILYEMPPSIKESRWQKQKITIRKKEQWKCGFCPTSFDCKDERDKHLPSCANERLFCTEGGCFYHTDKSKNLLRHLKSKHQKDDDSDSDKEANTSKSKDLLSGSSESEIEDEWKRQDPGDILGQDSDESAHSDKEEEKDTGLKETENRKMTTW